jgi:hypothetical protein
MEKRRPIQYSFDDIKRYKQGLMNREEMHAFEKASMEDPFLADALEGFMEADMAQAETHLHKIRQRITDKEAEKDKAVVVSMPKRSFAMLKVAAMVIFMAGVGLLVYKIYNNKNIVPPENAIARVDSTSAPIDSGVEVTLGSDDFAKPGGKEIAALPKQTEGTGQNASPSVNSDVSKAGTDIKEQSGVTQDKGKTALAMKDQSTTVITSASPVKVDDKTAEEIVTRNSAAITKEESAKLAEVQERTNRNFTANKRNVYEKNEIRGRVLNPSNQPLANANVTLDRSRRSFVTDNSGNFTFNANDTVLTATVNVEGYDNTRVQLRSNTDNTINLGNIALQPDATFDDVVVIGLGTDKTRVTDTISNKPLGGWQSFQEYVANKLNTVVDTTGSDMKMSRELELEFYVDAKGVPKDFKVLNAADAFISKEAINAVKSGPKWQVRRKKTRLLIMY